MLSNLRDAFYNGFQNVKALNKKRMNIEGKIVHGLNEASEHAHLFKKELHHELIEKPTHNRRKEAVLGKKEAVIYHVENNINDFNKKQHITNKKNLQLKTQLINKRMREINEQRKAKLVQAQKVKALPQGKTNTYVGNLRKGVSKDIKLVQAKLISGASNTGNTVKNVARNISVVGEPSLGRVSNQINSNNKVRKSYTINKIKYKLAYLSTDRQKALNYADYAIENGYRILKKATLAGYAVYIN